MKPKTRAGINGRTTTIAAVLVALALGGAATAKPLRTLAPGELRVGTYFVNPPFEYLAKGCTRGLRGQSRGGNCAAARAQADLRRHALGDHPQGDAGRYDCIVGGITITPARERILTWSVPCVTTPLSGRIAKSRPIPAKPRLALRAVGRVASEV
jgi:ABC-type amino acid transport substrate-binding protein